MSYKVYMHKTPSGGVYVGITRQSLKRRWRKNGIGYSTQRLFYRAINKYGWDNIEHKLLFDGLSELEAKMIEVDLIYYYKKIGKSYNITDGGDGVSGIHRVHSEESNKKRSEANKGRKPWSYGKTLTEEHKQKIKDGNIGKHSKPVLQFDKSGTFIKKWDSVSEAASFYNTVISSIVNCCTGRSKTCKKYIWRYE